MSWSHIFRESNICADRLASMRHSFVAFIWWDYLPLVSQDDFLRVKLDVPNYQLS
jgi:hypothetical protein